MDDVDIGENLGHNKVNCKAQNRIPDPVLKELNAEKGEDHLGYINCGLEGYVLVKKVEVDY